MISSVPKIIFNKTTQENIHLVFFSKWMLTPWETLTSADLTSQHPSWEPAWDQFCFKCTILPVVMLHAVKGFLA